MAAYLGGNAGGNGDALIVVRAESVPLRRRIFCAEALACFGPSALSAFSEDDLFAHCRDVVNSCASSTIHIKIVLGRASDFPLARLVWERIQKAFVTTPTLLVSIGTPCEPSRPPAAQLIVDVDGHAPLVLQNKLSAIGKSGGGTASVLVAQHAPFFLPDEIKAVFLTTNPQAGLFDGARHVAWGQESRVVFLKSALPNLHQRISRDFWKQLFANDIPVVLGCDDELNIEPLRLFGSAEATTLFVFPERMIPLQRAYYLRAFDLLVGLNYSGERSSVLVLGPNNKDLDRIRGALEIISPKVFAFPLIRGDYWLGHHALRLTETMVRKRSGFFTSPPIRFSERSQVFATKRNATLLRDAIEQEKSLRSVVYTGAWFTPAVLSARRGHPSLRFYCDTHDVFFVLDRDSNQDERRFLYDAKREKRRELNFLGCIDGVVAISNADFESIKAAGCQTPIVVESGSFSHAARGVNYTDGPEGLVFGFIGSNNKNNEKCLKIVRSEWWPRIISRNPDAVLLLAGGVCRAQEAVSLEEAYPDSVRRLGFVDRVSDFYAAVHAMLSPIAVQGGLNFKSVESLVAGRPLLTNGLGSKCIGPELEGVCIVGPDGDGIDDFIRRLRDTEVQPTWRRAIHDQAIGRFGEDVAYRDLVELLRSDRGG